jgi:hypothetical protein
MHEVVTESKQHANRVLQEAQKKLELDSKQEQAATFFNTFKKSILEDVEVLKQEAARKKHPN